MSSLLNEKKNNIRSFVEKEKNRDTRNLFKFVYVCI